MNMIRQKAASLVFLLALLAGITPLCGQELAVEAPKAITPEVQTAEWAVKWWMPRHEQKLKEKQQMGRVDLLMIGDSITHGWESGGKAIWEKRYAPRHAFNIGFSGDRTEQVLWRLAHGEVDGISPKLAVVMIGTNNTGHRQDPAQETAQGIKAIIDDLEKRLPETKILLLAIFPRGATADDPLRKLNSSINEIIAKYDDGKRVHFLDVSDAFLDANGKLPKSVMPDLLHPNPKGYELWADAMDAKIAELMGE